MGEIILQTVAIIAGAALGIRLVDDTRAAVATVRKRREEA